MKRFLILVVFIIGAFVAFSEQLYIFNGFSILTGEVAFEKGRAVIEVPYGVQVQPETFSVFGVPESTTINFVPGDSVESLYERNLGRPVKFVYEDGRVERLEVVSPLPVFRNSYGEIIVNPKGYPVFSDEFSPNARFLLNSQDSFSGESSFAYQVRNNSWTTRYSLSLKDFSLTGLMIVHLEMETDENVTLVSSNPGYGYATRDMAAKMVNESYSVSPTTSDAETRLYEISVPLKRGTNYIAFLSELFSGDKRLVFRASRGGSSFTGVEIDVYLNEVPVDLPSGVMEVWSESVYLGSAGIGNIAKGESVVLQSIARSIEVSGRKTTVTTLGDSKYRYYKNTYYVRNLSEETVTVEIEDYLGQNAEQFHLNCEDCDFEYIKETGMWTYTVSVDPGEVAEVEVEYRVRFAN